MNPYFEGRPSNGKCIADNDKDIPAIHKLQAICPGYIFIVVGVEEYIVLLHERNAHTQYNKKSISRKMRRAAKCPSQGSTKNRIVENNYPSMFFITYKLECDSIDDRSCAQDERGEAGKDDQRIKQQEEVVVFPS